MANETVKVYWHAPVPIFAARVNLASPIYPIADIPYDGVTTGAYTDTHADMLVTFGSAAGKDDYGRGRLRQQATANLLKIGRSSQGVEDGQVDIVNNAYITVYEDYRVSSKIPVIGPAPNYVEYKDTDIPVSDRTEEPPPIANLGSDFAGSIDPSTDTLTVFFAGSNSMAVADGATIASYAWEAPGGTFVNGTDATDADVYIEFEPGAHWVRLTVTDSNGKTNTGHRFVLADDPDDSLCVSGMQVQTITRTQQGSTARLRVLQELPRADYPDGAKVIIWEDRPSLDGVSRDHMLFVGWHQTDQASSLALETHLQRETELTCVDVAGRMDSLPGFAQRLEVPDEEEGLTWGEMPAANMDKFLHYLIQWHSTAAQVADFYPSGTWDEYPFVLFDSAGATLYEQMQRQANRIVPDHDFMSDRYGVMRVVVNPQYQNTDDRTATIQNSLTESAWSEIDFGYQRPPRVHTLRGSALLTQEEWEIDDDDEKQLLTPVFAIAPGTAPGQGGREQTLGERLAQSQEDLNDCVGHHYARLNARYSPINVTLNLNADPWDFDPAAHTWVQLLTSASTAPQRGLDFGTIRCLCKEVAVDFSYSAEAVTWRGRVVLERETVGLPALTEEGEGALPVGEQPVPPYVPDFGLISGQELVALVSTDGNLYRTSDFQTPSGSGGPTWDSKDTGITETIYSFVVDPFSPGYIAGSGSIDGWIATETDIYRVEDMFGTTPSVTSVHTFDTEATDSNFHWRSIQASFGAYFAEGSNPWLLCVSYYGDTDGHSGTWATHSLDGGATWEDEVQVSEFFDLATPERFNPIGVYTSPKTPGLAYTAAYTDTGVPVLTDGYTSLDWGATWARLSAAPVDDPSAPTPHWGIILEGVLIEDRASPFVSLDLGLTSSNGGTTASGQYYLLVAPPTNAVRVRIEGTWTETRTASHGTGIAFVGSISNTNEANAGADTDTLSKATGATTNGDPLTQDFVLEYTRNVGQTDWEKSRDDLASSPPTAPTGYLYVSVAASVSTTTGRTASEHFQIHMTVVEIELEDATIYTPPLASGGAIRPVHAQAGSIHLPWPDNGQESLIYFGALNKSANRVYRLMESDGGTVTDISPSDGSRSYGTNRYGFSIRAYDSNRQYLLLSGTGNDTSADPDDDYHAIYVSDDFGATWSEVVAPVADSADFEGRPAFEGAFAGDNPAVLYIWGPPDTVGYSNDSGATVDSRAGNLSGTGVIVGIAGGPAA